MPDCVNYATSNIHWPKEFDIVIPLILVYMVSINRMENCGLNITTKTLYVLLSCEYGKIARSNPAVGPDKFDALRSNLNNNQAECLSL